MRHETREKIRDLVRARESCEGAEELYDILTKISLLLDREPESPTEKEWHAIVRAVEQAHSGEDVIGVLLYTGAFWYLEDESTAIVDCAKKIEAMRSPVEIDAQVVKMHPRKNS